MKKLRQREKSSLKSHPRGQSLESVWCAQESESSPVNPSWVLGSKFQEVTLERQEELVKWDCAGSSQEFEFPPYWKLQSDVKINVTLSPLFKALQAFVWEMGWQVGPGRTVWQ